LNKDAVTIRRARMRRASRAFRLTDKNRSIQLFAIHFIRPHVSM
jgi:hypothetical protein